ncbi:MAG: FadD3 family acyl-CoA ligase [Pseudomonadota bacterium]
MQTSDRSITRSDNTPANRVADTLPQVIEHAARQHRDRIAITDGDRSLSYLELDRARTEAARAFLALGVNKGDRIAIWAPNMYQWVLAALGAQSVGGVLVPLNTRFKGEEAAFILRASKARILFTVDEFLGVNYPDQLLKQSLPHLERKVLLSGSRKDCLAWEQFMDLGRDIDPARLAERVASIAPEDTLDILFTSGTTGQPKGVVTSHGQNIRTFRCWSETVGLRSDDNYLIVNPFFHAFGYKAGWLASILCGARMLPIKQFDLDEVLELIAREKISMLPGPPTIYHSLLAHPLRNDYDLSSLRLAVTGAAPVPVSLVEQMRAELGFELVVTAYGLTEACGVVTMCRAEDSAERISHSSGRAMDGVELRCVDTMGNDVGAGETGEIWCRGFNIMQGYLDNPSATSDAITEDGWLRTGDVATMDADGYVRITDRIKDMFIVGGFNCYPAEIENALCDMPGITQAAVIGVADDRLGEVPKAFLVRESKAEVDDADVIAWSRDRMANYKVPREVEFLDELPRNASGKVLKTQLRKPAGSSTVE